MSVDQGYFDRLFAQSDDPWSMQTRYYEKRKRAVTLSALPHPRYARAFEPGCANGELSAELALRCDALLVADCTPRAIELARIRLAGFDHVRVDERRVPEEWPEGTFDLVVISELGYFLERPSLLELFDRAVSSLAPNGVVLLCHWRRPIEGCQLLGDDVHAAFGARAGLTPMVQHREADFLLDVHARDPRSVGEREGLR